MKYWAIDFETFYSDEFTLKRLTTDEYISDPCFESLCLSAYDGQTEIVLPQHEIASWLISLDQAKTGFVVQHGHFDGAILDRHYGFRPAFWVDTLLMSRALHGLNMRHSLSELCKRYGLPPKTVDYAGFKGLRWAQMTPARRWDLANDCLGDSKRTWAIACQMIPKMPSEELRVIDLTIRMFCEPVIVGNQQRLNALVTTERQRKQELLDALQVSPADIMSDDRFEALLERMGIDIVYKDAKNKRGYKGAFAKSDQFMKDLSEDPDEQISGVAGLRLDLKSTIQESRATRFLSASKRGFLRVYYHYYGTDTSHFSGGDKCNYQNLPSRGKNGVELRKSIRSGVGRKLVVGDMSQIQCRMLCAIAGQHDKLQGFREKRDLYCELASKYFGRTITKEDIFERQLGKTGLLQLGFQSGWGKVQSTAKRMFGVDMSEDDCKLFVRTYRDDNMQIAGWRDGRQLTGGIWQKAETWLRLLAQGETFDVWAPAEPGQSAFERPLFTIKGHKVILPTGLMLHYDGLHWGDFKRKEGDMEVTKSGWKLPRLDGFKVLYGGKFTQNLIAAFSRLAFTQAELRVQDRVRAWDGRVCLHTHDDMAVEVPEEFAPATKDIMEEELTRPLWWLPNIPLAVEVKILEDYAK